MSLDARSQARLSTGGSRALVALLVLGCLFLPYFYRLGDVPLIKVDEVWGAQPSWEIWTHGRFALPAFKGQLHQEIATYFHPPGFYLVNALFVGPLEPSTWSVRVAPTLFALLSFIVLYVTLGRILAWSPRGRLLSLAGAAIAAWNPMTFVLSRHGRPETWILLLGTCAVFLARPNAWPARHAAPAASPATPRPSEFSPLPVFLSGLLSGYALFSHYWAWVLPGALALYFISQRAWKALAWYVAGTSIFTAVTAGWILANRADFTADLMWHRSAYLTNSAQGYFQKRFGDHLAILRDSRAACTWWLEVALLAALTLPGARPVRWLTLALLAAVHLLVILFPRPSIYYTIAIVYFCAGAIPIALAHAWNEAGPGHAWRSRGLVLALAVVIAVPAALLGVTIWRDHDASYAAAFGPLREAVDRADPAKAGVTVGSEIQYFAFWDRPFLIRWNPYLWKLEPPNSGPEALVRRWRSIGIRFVLTSSFMPGSTPLSPLGPTFDRALVGYLRANGRTLAQSETRYYGEPEHKYEPGRVEVIDIGAGTGDPSNTGPGGGQDSLLLGQ